MHRKRNVIIALLVALVLIVIMAIIYGLNRRDTNQTNTPFYSRLTGEKVTKEVSELPIFGVMIENSPEARPQTGLADASIVFEAVTEGGITRYLALYQEDVPEIVGPVRSLRSHFLDWAMGFDIAFAHVGGSPEALDLAEDRNAKSLNQFTHNGPYYREDSRQAPHNMYARTADLRELQRELDYTGSDFDEFIRKNDAASETPDAKPIVVDYSSPTYLVEFRYDDTSNGYVRYLGGVPHSDSSTEEPIVVKNVIVIKTKRQGDQTTAVGSGEATIFMDGKAQTGRWQKPSFDDQIIFTDAKGDEISLNRGKSWIAVLPEDKRLSY